MNLKLINRLGRVCQNFCKLRIDNLKNHVGSWPLFCPIGLYDRYKGISG